MYKSLDMYLKRPDEMTAYLSRHGWHFSKKAAMLAIDKMRKKDEATGEETKIKAMTYDEVDDLLTRYGVSLKNDNGYDKVYVAAMAKADYLGSSVPDEAHLALFVKNFLDDPDGTEEKAMRHWYSDMIEKGKPIPWEEMI